MGESEDSALMNNILDFSKLYGAIFEEILKRIDSENSRAGIRILFILKKLGPMPISHIAEKMSIARPNMTLIVDTLTNKGFVERCSSDTDRRIINVALTEQGIIYLDQVVRRRNEILREKISLLTEIEQDEVAKALDLLIIFGNKVLNS